MSRRNERRRNRSQGKGAGDNNSKKPPRHLPAGVGKSNFPPPTSAIQGQGSAKATHAAAYAAPQASASGNPFPADEGRGHESQAGKAKPFLKNLYTHWMVLLGALLIVVAALIAANHEPTHPPGFWLKVAESVLTEFGIAFIVA